MFADSERRGRKHRSMPTPQLSMSDVPAAVVASEPSVAASLSNEEFHKSLIGEFAPE